MHTITVRLRRINQSETVSIKLKQHVSHAAAALTVYLGICLENIHTFTKKLRLTEEENIHLKNIVAEAAERSAY